MGPVIFATAVLFSSIFTVNFVWDSVDTIPKLVKSAKSCFSSKEDLEETVVIVEKDIKEVAPDKKEATLKTKNKKVTKKEFTRDILKYAQAVGKNGLPAAGLIGAVAFQNKEVFIQFCKAASPNTVMDGAIKTTIKTPEAPAKK